MSNLLPMVLSLGRRILWLMFTLWAVFTISFLLMVYSPGGPFLGERKLPDEIRRPDDRGRAARDHPLARRVKQPLRRRGPSSASIAG